MPTLTRIPGIGEEDRRRRVVLELKDKLEEMAVPAAAGRGDAAWGGRGGCDLRRW